MPDLPIRQRKFHAFLSHAHADNTMVDGLFTWLNDVAGIPVWYDARNLPAGAMIATELANAISQCRAMIIILSKTSINSGWVKEEYEAAIGQRTQFKEFWIIPICIEECQIPGFLRTTKWFDLSSDKYDVATYSQLLMDLYYDENTGLDWKEARDVYVSRTWRETEERCLADHVCRCLIKTGFRLIGDAQDQKGFDEARVASIISSCGGLAAVLPDRGQGITSKYLLREITIAQKLGLSYLIVAEPTVDLTEDLAKAAIRIANPDAGANGAVKTLLQNGIEALSEEWKQPAQPSYSFFGTAFDENYKQRNQVIKRMLQCLTAMPCIIGDEIREGRIQHSIAEFISHAVMVIADISEDNLNTCIEAGIARGAGRDLYLVAQEPRRRPPFMFRDQQVWYYRDDVDLLGRLHRIARPYRRRVLNWELANDRSL